MYTGVLKGLELAGIVLEYWVGGRSPSFIYYSLESSRGHVLSILEAAHRGWHVCMVNRENKSRTGATSMINIASDFQGALMSKMYFCMSHPLFCMSP